MTSPDFQTLSLSAIRSAMSASTYSPLHDILIFEQVSSTNEVLWQRFEEGHTGPAACLAEIQTAGRGRRGDKWHSPNSGNLYLSVFWPHSTDMPHQGLSIAIGISLINTLKERGINDLQLKWPNDILFDRQKLAGILVESRYSTSQNIVIGIGLNFKLPKSIQDQIQQPTTCLEQICDVLPDRNHLAGKVIQNMIKTITLFENRGLSDFLPVWPQYDALHQQMITLISEHEQITVLACGINEKGELRYLRDQQLHLLSSSHVSIRFAS